MKTLFLSLVLMASMWGVEAFALEPQCPGGANPDPTVVFCDDFTDSTVHSPTFITNWNVDNYCCWAAGTGTANGHANQSEQTGVFIRDPIIYPGGYNPGKCKLPNDCRGNGTTWVGPQGFASPNAWFSGYYWECCGNHYGNRRLPGNYTELRFRWYVYLNDGWNIPCLSTNCGAKMFMLANGSINQSMGYMMLYTRANGPDGQPLLDVYADPSEFKTQNQGNNLVLHGNQWYLFEWHVRLNTASNLNGLSEFWIDAVTPGVPFTGPQTLRERHTNVRFTGDGGSINATSWGAIGISPNSNYGYCRPGQQRNDGANGAPPCPTSSGQVLMVQPDAYYKISNIVISTGAAIGPILSTIGTSTVPAAPTGLGVK